MRAITGITIRKEEKNFTMFLTYNGNENDYSFNPYNSEEEAIQSLPKGDDYFPVKTDNYRFLEIKGNKTLVDETRKLQNDN